VRTERKRAAAGKLLEAPEVSFAKTTRGVPRRFLSSPTHEPPYLYIHAHRSHLLIHEKSISHTARHPFQTALSLRRERRGDGRLLLELIIVGVRRGADRRLGTRLPQELAPDLTRRPEPPQARTGPLSVVSASSSRRGGTVPFDSLGFATGRDSGMRQRIHTVYLFLGFSAEIFLGGVLDS
jgi:hypothetical protein